MSDNRTGQGPHSAPCGERITVSVREAMELTGSSKSFIHKCIREGTLESARVGDRRFISAESLKRVFTTK